MRSLRLCRCFPVSWCYLYVRVVVLKALVVPNVFVRPPNQRKEADAAKALLTVPDGDHLTLMNVYNSYEQSAC